MRIAIVGQRDFGKAVLEAFLARRDTVAVSLAKTFDGRHPCPICWSLSKAAPSASLAAAPSHSRLGFVPPSAGPRVARVAVAWGVASSAPPAFTRSLRPSAPPPKNVLS